MANMADEVAKRELENVRTNLRWVRKLGRSWEVAAPFMRDAIGNLYVAVDALRARVDALAARIVRCWGGGA